MIEKDISYQSKERNCSFWFFLVVKQVFSLILLNGLGSNILIKEDYFCAEALNSHQSDMLLLYKQSISLRDLEKMTNNFSKTKKTLYHRKTGEIICLTHDHEGFRIWGPIRLVTKQTKWGGHRDASWTGLNQRSRVTRRPLPSPCFMKNILNSVMCDCVCGIILMKCACHAAVS